MSTRRIGRGLSFHHICVVLILFVSIAATAQTTIRVPSDRSTIQAAIDVAVAGDTVLVSPGTYNERIDFKGKGITVKSTDGATKTIIDGQSNGSVVTFKNYETNAAVLSGFTIQHGKAGDGGGIYIAYSTSPRIEYNIVAENGCGEGGGIGVEFASPVIRYNIIHHNNRAADCYPGGGGGGGIAISGAGTAQVLYNLIYENKGGYDGGGIEMWAAGNALIEGNVIRDNISTSSRGGGLNLDNEGTSIVRNNVIVNNHGGGVYWGRMPAEFSNNTVAYNSADQYTAELSAFSFWDGKVRNNVIVASPGGKAIECESSTTYGITASNFTYNNVYGNGGTAYTCPDQTGSNHNISVDPLFANPLRGDMHVATGSPVIDASDPTTTPVPANDAGLEPRVVNGAMDLGGYEYQGETTFVASPLSLGFSTQKANTSSTSQTVTVTNNGAKSLHLKPMEIGSDFVEGDDCVSPSGVAPGVSCTVAISFRPLSAGAKAETLDLVGANSTSTATVDLSGTGSAPVATLSATSVDFGDQALNTTSVAKTVTLTNTGDADLVVNSISVTGDFAITQNCGVLAPGADCTISITFKPSLTRLRTGAITIVDDAQGAPHSVSLTGNGTGPEIAFSPTTMGFLPQPVNTIGTPEKVTVTNTGTSDLSIAAIQISGDYTQTNTCVAPIPPGSSCEVTVTFMPTLYGSRPGTLSFVDDAALSPQTVALSGLGVAPIAIVSTTSVNFVDPVVIGYQGTAQVLYRNVGNDVLLITGMSTSGEFAQTNQCGVALAPYQTCAITVTFTPTQAGARTGSLVITDNAYGSPRTITLAGQGAATFPTPSITSTSPESARVSDTNTVVTIKGSGFTASSTAYLDAVALATTYVNSTTLTAKVASVSIGEHSVTVINPTPGGGSSNALKLAGYFSIPLSARDLVYDPYRRVFYASIAAAASTSPNTIVPIDPATGKTGTPIAIGSDPSVLAISDDGQFLWVGVNGEMSVKRVNLYTKQIDLVIPISGTYYFSSLVAVPGSPHSVAVVANGVTIYDDAVARPKLGGGYYTSWVTFGADASILYGTEGGVSPPTLFTMKVDSTGIVPGTSRWSAGGAELHYLNGRLYGSSRLYDATTLADAGYFGFVNSWVTSVFPEPGTGLAYLLEALSDGTGQNVKIWSAETKTLSATGHLQISVPNDYVRPIQRWGRDGLAFRYYGGALNVGGATPQDQVIVVRSSITNPSTTDNPVPSIASLNPMGVSAGTKNFFLTINGSNFVPGAVVRWNGSDRTTLFVNGTTLRAWISSDDVATAGTASITVENPTPAGGESAAAQFIIGTWLSLSSNQLDFGSQAKKKPSKAQTLTVTNAASTSVAILQIATTGDFTQTNDCGVSLAPGAACTVSVVFSPSAEGARNGSLTISSDGLISSHQVALTGVGLGAAVSISSSGLNFGPIVVGTNSTQTVTFTNAGPANLAITSLSATGPFTATSDCGAALAAGASCTITVKFTPSSAGRVAGNLTIQHDSGSGKTELPLEGVGTNFAIAAQSGSTTSASINAGQSATYSLAVSGSDQFTGSVAFTCTGAPALSTCTINPTSASLQSGSQVNVTVTVATTAPSAAGLQAQPPSRGLPPLQPAVPAILACAILLVMMARPKQASWASASLVFVLAMVGCGGGGGGSTTTPQPKPGTPAGIYMVTLTATGAGVSKTLDLTLTVK